VGRLINAVPGEIVFTSGATEANNLAVLGVARFRHSLGRHLVTALTEHASVLEPFRQLEREGFRVNYLRPGPGGIVGAAAVLAALRPDTTLVSLMHVNNETGVVQDIAAIGAACRARGVVFHSDASQSAGRVPLDVRSQQVDLLTLSGHKMYGPKGVGALYIREALAAGVQPLMYGGEQERGLRPGTLPTHQVAGLGKAAELARERWAEDGVRTAPLRDELWRRIAAIPGVFRNGDAERCTGHILNVTVTGVEGESLLHELSGLSVSGGAACAAGRGEPSGVLRALGRSDALAQSSIRFSLGRHTTAADIERASAMVSRAIERLRSIAPVSEAPHEVLPTH
jgi:cysteine desulfurase